jgi:flagellar biosynthetic protein FliO
VVAAALLAVFPSTALAAGRPTRHAASSGTAKAGHHKTTPRAPSFHQDTTPLPAAISGRSGTRAAPASVGSASGAIVRTIVGLAVVLAVVYGLYWLLRSAAKARAGTGDERIAVIATTPLGPGRNLHLIRSGDELILIGASEQSITQLRVYTPDQAARIELDARVAAQPGAGSSASRPGMLEMLRRMTER